ncbi:MAG: TraB/GumN family protein [Bacteroides sp.]
MKTLFSLLLLVNLTLCANAQLLWKISGKGLEQPSYVFGTYHLSPLSIKDSINGMSQAINETKQLYGEIIMSESKEPAFIQKAQQLMMLPKDTTLKSLFTPEDYELLGKVVKETMKIDIAMLSQLKPAFINTQLAILFYLQHSKAFNPQEQLDTYFQQQAVQQGKKVGGLESSESQLEVLFNSATLQRQADLLACTAKNVEEVIEKAKQIVEYYQTQNLDEIFRLINEDKNEICGSTPEELDVMIYNRNRAWVKKMPAIMSEAPTLFVVGVGHLPGKQGVLKLLEKQGYKVEAMK